MQSTVWTVALGGNSETSNISLRVGNGRYVHRGGKGQGAGTMSIKEKSAKTEGMGGKPYKYAWGTRLIYEMYMVPQDNDGLCGFFQPVMVERIHYKHQTHQGKSQWERWLVLTIKESQWGIVWIGLMAGLWGIFLVMVREVRRPSLKATVSWAGPWMVQRKDEAEHSTCASFHSAPAKGMDVASPALSRSCYCDFFTVVKPKHSRPSLSCSHQDAFSQQKGKLEHHLTSARRALKQRKKDIVLAREWRKENPFSCGCRWAKS